MLDRLRRAILGIDARAQLEETIRLVRRLRAIGIDLVRHPSDLAERLQGFDRIADIHERETGSWVTIEEYGNGKRGPFDACDLRFWIAMAERVGVPVVPVVEVLRLTEREVEVLSGAVRLPDDRVTRGVVRRLAGLIGPGEPRFEEPVDSEAVVERTFAAMDAVPEGWMVRGSRCGAQNLKSLAGTGLAGPTSPDVRFGPDLEVGPGWVRVGNRRRVHVSDMRTIKGIAEGPSGEAVFLARPWIEASRYFVGEDIHRRGSPIAGNGMWPSEWRAFVERGRVIGVSSYYGWCGEVTPTNATVALEVRDLAQRIVDEAMGIGMHPRSMDIEFVRQAGGEALTKDPRIDAALETFPADSIGCTLDFIEAPEGIMLLEGGPPNTPFGGGHPCSFAGCGGRPIFGNRTDTVGVAFRIMPHVNIADPSTWEDGDRTGCILDWEAVADLALKDEGLGAVPIPARGR